jgi:cytoskeletal protein RodZ
LQFLAAGIATVSLIVAGAILWGFRPSADSTHAPAARSAIVDAAVISPKPEPTPDTSVRIATPDQKSESAASVKPDKGMGIHRETGTAKHAETPHVGKARSQNATDDAVATTETSPAPQPAEPKIEKAETPLPVQSNPEKTQERTAAAPPTAPAARTPDDPFDPLRTAEDYILQGSYRRAMDLATQFGRQDPMRAWEIFGRAACGLRLADRANRAFRELQQRHEDRRISSLQEYCRLHKLILSGAP